MRWRHPLLLWNKGRRQKQLPDQPEGVDLVVVLTGGEAEQFGAYEYHAAAVGT